MLSEFFVFVKEYIPLAISIVLVSSVLWLANWFLLKRKGIFTVDSKNIRQMTVLTLLILGLLLILFNIPMDVATRGQILSLFGLVITGVIAFSSSSFIANIMAGLMLRFIKSFNPGDFITIENQSGRVTEVGIMHTEIQNENRELVTFPNIYIMSKPVTVVRRSGTIISTELSLGYDENHTKIEVLLKAAAIDAGLEDPFVLIKNLGDFSITYHVAGFLSDIKTLITQQSVLMQKTLDSLHNAGIEIVSPNFMNQRVLEKGQEIIPKRIKPTPAKTKEETPESIIFDKAEKAESLDHQKKKIEEDIEAISQLKKTAKETTGEDREKLDKKIETAEAIVTKKVEALNKKKADVDKKD